MNTLKSLLDTLRDPQATVADLRLVETAMVDVIGDEGDPVDRDIARLLALADAAHLAFDMVPRRDCERGTVLRDIANRAVARALWLSAFDATDPEWLS